MAYRRYRKRWGRKSVNRFRATLALRQPRATIKQHFASLSNTDVHDGVIFELGAIAQGSSDQERLNNVIRTVDLTIRGVFKMGASSLEASAWRFVVFEWRQGYVSPTVSTIFNPNTSLRIMAPLNQVNARNYTVLSDQRRVLNQYAANQDMNGLYTLHLRIPRTITFEDYTSTSGDKRYFLIVCSDLPDYATFNSEVGFRFVDV